MWSDRYNYYNIQSDEHFTEKVEVGILHEMLLKTGCFKQKNLQTFSNTDNFPWVEIVLSDTVDGSFATSEKELNVVTLIAIVCSKGQNIDQSVYINVFSKIARALNWKLYLEQDDEENENIEINIDF